MVKPTLHMILQQNCYQSNNNDILIEPKTLCASTPMKHSEWCKVSFSMLSKYINMLFYIVLNQ